MYRQERRKVTKNMIRERKFTYPRFPEAKGDKLTYRKVARTFYACSNILNQSSSTQYSVHLLMSMSSQCQSHSLRARRRTALLIETSQGHTLQILARQPASVPPAAHRSSAPGDTSGSDHSDRPGTCSPSRTRSCRSCGAAGVRTAAAARSRGCARWACTAAPVT